MVVWLLGLFAAEHSESVAGESSVDATDLGRWRAELSGQSDCVLALQTSSDRHRIHCSISSLCAGALPCIWMIASTRMSGGIEPLRASHNSDSVRGAASLGICLGCPFNSVGARRVAICGLLCSLWCASLLAPLFAVPACFRLLRSFACVVVLPASSLLVRPVLSSPAGLVVPFGLLWFSCVLW